MKLGISLAILTIVFATPITAQSYKSPNNSNRRGNSNNQSQIVRGCRGEQAEITLIAPEEGISSTSSSNPTFLIDLERLPPTPLIVSITQPKVIETFYYKEFVPKKAGRLAIETEGNLLDGEYILTIGYFCQRNPDRDAIYLRVIFHKKALSPEQELELSQSTNPKQLLSDWGFYFDAAAWQYKEPISNPSEF